jgi:hypothetical protein
MVLAFSFPAGCFGGCGSGRDEEPSGEGAVLRQIQIRLATLSLQKSTPACQEKIAASANRRFKFEKRCRLLIAMGDKSLSVVPMRVNYPDSSPVGIHG